MPVKQHIYLHFQPLSGIFTRCNRGYAHIPASHYFPGLRNRNGFGIHSSTGLHQFDGQRGGDSLLRRVFLGRHGYNHPLYGSRELLRFIRSGFDRAVVGIGSRDRHGLGIVRRSERKRRRVELGNLRFSGCITILSTDTAIVLSILLWLVIPNV